MTDAQLEDELERRSLCRQMQADGRAHLFAECARVAPAPAPVQLAANQARQPVVSPPPVVPQPQPEPDVGQSEKPPEQPPTSEGEPQDSNDQPQEPDVDQTTNEQTDPYSQRGMRDNGTGRQNFGGIDFGVGLAFTLDLGERMRVREAQLVNGVVRVTRSGDVNAGLILEMHHLFTPPGRGFPLLGIRNPTLAQMEAKTNPMLPVWGFGPFIAVRPGSDSIIDAIGGGLMLGLRRPVPGTASFNLGVGVLYDIDVQTLGDGIFENQPLPEGETEIRFQRRAQSGLMVMSSFTF